MRLIALSCAVVLTFAACSGSPTGGGTIGPDKQANGKGNAQGQGGGGKNGGRGQNGSGNSSNGGPQQQGDAGGGDQGSGSQGSNDGSSKDEAPQPQPADPAMATGTSEVRENARDAQRTEAAPAWADIKSVRVEGTGDSLRILYEFFDDVPERMDDPEVLSFLGVTLREPTGDQQSWTLGANCSQSGWAPYATSSHNQKDGDYPGTFKVIGTTIEMVVPWSYFKGPRALRWSANFSWFDSGSSPSEYSYDQVPDDGKFAEYPS